ncbi:carbohydrate kinase family protein [Lysobacter korlensis]|uniref:Carbohydrate kinase family protein n=1 Tax=Lysobacter korlensis TaxID=553636 RepID=A0ABV6RU01_9GAMM
MTPSPTLADPFDRFRDRADTFDVFVQGTVFLDIVMTGLRARPAAGTEVFTDGMGSCPGGIANLAIASSRLGLSTSLSAAFGDDLYGDFCWGTLQDAEGVDLSRSRRMPGWPTPVTVSMAFADDRSMVTHMRPTPIGEDELVGTPPEARATIVYLSHDAPAWRERAREQGTLVFADVGWDGGERWSSAVLDQLSGCHAFLPNDVEATAYTRTDDPEAALRRLADLVPITAVTSGSAGSRAIDHVTGEQAWAPGVPVIAQDTTGAGDVFDTGFTLGTLRGWPLADRLAFANLCAALSVQHVGGSLAAPGWGDIADWWADVRLRARNGDLATSELARRYGFLDDVVPDGTIRTVRRAAATLARNSDA